MNNHNIELPIMPNDMVWVLLDDKVEKLKVQSIHYKVTGYNDDLRSFPIGYELVLPKRKTISGKFIFNFEPYKVFKTKKLLFRSL